VAHTWPLATNPGVLSRNDNGDAVLHEWIMAWVAHQVVTDPWHLFDANIFYPERYTLAYSDHLFVQSMLAAPLLWAGASPVLAHNLVLILGFALTGWTTSLVVTRWTGSWLAGAVSGSLLAFNAFSLTRLPQIQDLHLQFFPLALAALDRLLAAPAARHALALAAWYVLHSLTGTYVMVFSTFSLAAAAIARPGEWLGARFGPVAKNVGIAAALAVGLLAPFLLPYWFASRDVGLGRSLDEVRPLSAELTDYFATGGRIHFDTWSGPYFQGDALFPGVTAILLTIVSLATMVALRDRRARMALGVGLVAFAMSFGPSFPPYEWLYGVFPLLTGIRGAVRFGQFVLVAMALLAGFGLAALQQRLSRRAALIAGVGLLLTANAEALRAPLWYYEYPGVAPIYQALSKVGPQAVVVWLPFPPSHQFHLNAPFMLVGAKDFPRMLNGYSGFKPPSYRQHADALASFPDAESIEYLRAQGVTHVLVDGRNMRPERLGQLSQVRELSLWETDGNLGIYLLSRP
jgi:hypothetical protein